MPRSRTSLLNTARKVPGSLPLLLELRRSLRHCESVLDLGCGKGSPLSFLKVRSLTGLEGFEPALQEAQRNATHDELVLGDVRQVREVFAERRFDACVALDLIEHLPKQDGWKLLEDMERLAERRVIVFTPSGFLPQRGQGDLQEHLSGWSADDLRLRGYRVVGLYGLKALRGEYHQLKQRPKLFWGVVSLLSQAFVARWRPESAAALFCVKDLACCRRDGSTPNRSR